MKDQLIQKFSLRDAQIAVIGLGYVGLPLAVAFAEAGFQVIGIDVDQTKVDIINSGKSHVGDVSGEAVVTLVTTGHLRSTTDFSILSECDAVSICVPTPLSKTHDPDLSYVIAAADAIAEYLHAGMLVVLESTTYPGTTEEIVVPRMFGNGLTVGEDVFVAFSPERIDPGRTDYTLKNTPKVIGGMTEACSEVAAALYGTAVEQIVPVTSSAAAEMVKLVENTYRSVNIALANEFLIMCDKLDLDAWEIIGAAATKPFGFTAFTPGPGVGGHCIPLDPHYLSWKLRTVNYDARFVQLATQINTGMPAYWVDKVVDALNEVGKSVKGSDVLVLGIAYKRDIDDVRESPALDIIDLLRQKGANVRYHDPFVLAHSQYGYSLFSETDWALAATEADCVLIATDHSLYDWNKLMELAHDVVDTRNVTNIGAFGLRNGIDLDKLGHSSDRSDAMFPNEPFS